MMVGGAAAGSGSVDGGATVAANATGIALIGDVGDGTLVTFATGIARAAGTLLLDAAGED